LHIGPACEAGLSAGMRRERAAPQIRKKEKESYVTSIAMLSCFPTQNFTEIRQLAADLRPKMISGWQPYVILNFYNFHIWSHDCHLVPYGLLCTKFHQNRIIFIEI